MRPFPPGGMGAFLLSVLIGPASIHKPSESSSFVSGASTMHQKRPEMMTMAGL